MRIRVIRVRQLKAKKDERASAWLLLTINRTIDNEAGYLLFDGYSTEAFDFGSYSPSGKRMPSTTKTIRVGFAKHEAEPLKKMLKKNPIVRIWLNKTVEVI